MVTLAVGAAGGKTSVAANAPYLAALVLWALFNYWEAYGRGDGRPLSAYLVLRAWGPPLIALLFLLAGSDLPTYAAGIAECVALVVVETAFRLAPVARSRPRSARHADRGGKC